MVSVTPGNRCLAQFTWEVDVDDHVWPVVMEWYPRIATWVLMVMTTRRRNSSYAAAIQVLRQLPAGGEAAGILADGSVWYVRVPETRR